MKNIIKKYIKSIVIIGILLIICDFLSALPPYIVKQVVDIDFTRKDIMNTILFFICIYTSIHLGRLIFKYVRDVLINTTICKILRDIRKMLFDKILNFKMSTFNKKKVYIYTSFSVLDNSNDPSNRNLCYYILFFKY